MAGKQFNDSVTLWITSGPSAGRRIRVPRTGTVLGRTVDGPGRLAADPQISGRHAELRWDGDGVLYIRDLKSTNGTMVNGGWVDESDLNDGDEIQIGSTVLDVSVPEASWATAPDFAGTSVQGGQSASDAGVNVGGNNLGRITAESHKYEVNVESGLLWWTRARGPARVAIVLGMILALAGFGFFGYPIVRAFGGQDAARQAETECYSKFPRIGQEQVECLIQAAQQTSVRQFTMSPWTQIGAGLGFAGLTFVTIAWFLPGARPRRTRRRRE
jgi:hypothetical protein